MAVHAGYEHRGRPRASVTAFHRGKRQIKPPGRTSEARVSVGLAASKDALEKPKRREMESRESPGATRYGLPKNRGCSVYATSGLPEFSSHMVCQSD